MRDATCKEIDPPLVPFPSRSPTISWPPHPAPLRPACVVCVRRLSLGIVQYSTRSYTTPSHTPLLPYLHLPSTLHSALCWYVHRSWCAVPFAKSYDGQTGWRMGGTHTAKNRARLIQSGRFVAALVLVLVLRWRGGSFCGLSLRIQGGLSGSSCSRKVVVVCSRAGFQRYCIDTSLPSHPFPP